MSSGEADGEERKILAANYLYWQENGKYWIEEYDRRRLSEPYFLIQEVVWTTLFLLHRPCRVLELGCGVGRHLRYLSQIEGIEIYGADQSLSMLEGCRSWADEAWCESRLKLVSPTDTLPFADGSFDYVISCEALIHTCPEDIPGRLREMSRLARKAVLHVEPSPDCLIYNDAHDGSWNHNLIENYRHLGMNAIRLGPVGRQQELVALPIEPQWSAFIPNFFLENCLLLDFQLGSASTGKAMTQSSIEPFETQKLHVTSSVIDETLDQSLAIRQIVRRTFYANASDEYMASESGQAELHEHVVSRSATARDNVIPWLSSITDLAGKHVIEFGSGTGAIASVFAQQGAHIHGYEIEASSVEAARGRARVLGLDNCHFSHVDPELLPAFVQAEWEGRADIAMFFAVLEHTTHEEAINLIRSAWACLKPGGLLVVADTPNRLSYCDYHTSYLPFYNNMSDDMIVAEAWRSPRDGFRQEFAGRPMDNAQRVSLVRWGRGVSYHAFETAIGWDVHNYVALPGYEAEITRVWPVVLEDSIMLTYFKAKPVNAHDAFARSALNFVLRKPE